LRKKRVLYRKRHGLKIVKAGMDRIKGRAFLFDEIR
jgi:hypothetical protein